MSVQIRDILDVKIIPEITPEYLFPNGMGIPFMSNCVKPRAAKRRKGPTRLQRLPNWSKEWQKRIVPYLQNKLDVLPTKHFEKDYVVNLDFLKELEKLNVVKTVVTVHPELEGAS